MAATMFSDQVVLATEPKKTILPWLRDLDGAEQETFLSEFIDAFARCSATEELLEDWQATAEAHRTPELLETWRTRGRTDEYIPMVIPHTA